MKEYRQVAKMIRAMAHPVRLQILEALVSGPACVCELVVKIGRRQACISQHLMLLRQTGLVKRTRLGLNMRYELTSESTGSLLKCIFQDAQPNNVLSPSQIMMLDKQPKHDAKVNRPIAG